MLRESVLALVMLIVIVLSASCSPREVGPAPVMTAEVTAIIPDESPGGSAATAGTEPGSFMPPGATDEIADWWGVIRKTPPGAQYDDYFERQDLGQVIYFGIDSMDPAVQSQIKALRDSGKIVHLYGALLSNVPDYGGAQIRVDRIEVEE